MNRRRVGCALLGLVAAAFSVGLPVQVAAQAFPNKSVTLVVPAPRGALLMRRRVYSVKAWRAI